ncbi:tyrosine-type recombinase/integrase [Nocardia otitidiscaviarum]|uniref:tyrosine-type recombinase/integrase n=1 Tax=Nocardia otitidiscaviarum TaxID=1823 RepID=UPI0018963CD2|nr:tyrosine-type recombinase/integrase [Nocardia otitidiscaviarum]MBF6238674.1 tyrosine-type recombinase/integrase [Nocardia otitidiscaviarum]
MKGHVRKRGKTWYYQFRLPEKGPDGSEPTETKGGFATEKAAWEACRIAMAAVEGGKHVKKTKTTVKSFLLEWLPAIEMIVDATTYDNWQALAKAYAIPRLGATELQKLTTPMLMKFYAQLLTDGRIKPDNNMRMYEFWVKATSRGREPTPAQVVTACGVTIHAARAAVRRFKDGRIPTPKPAGLAPKTVRNIHVMLHRAFTDAVAWKYVVDNPAEKAKPPRVPRSKRPVWTPEQAAAFMNSIRYDRFYALYLLELSTGLRRAEICGIRWPSLDLDTGVLSVHEGRVVVAGRAQDAQVKTDDSARMIALDTATVTVLKQWKAVQDAERPLYGDDYKKTGLVFTWEDGSAVHPDTVRERFKRLAARAELPEIRFYDLRHTYVTGALTAGVSPKVVSQRVGHADVAFTMKTYQHVLPGQDEDAAARAATHLLGGHHEQRGTSHDG